MGRSSGTIFGMLPPRNRYGVVTRAELREQGNSAEWVTAAVADGRLEAVRRDLFVRRGTHPDVVASLKLGGRLTCLAALRFHNLWSIDKDLHVNRGGNARHRWPAAEDVHDCRPVEVHGHNGAVDDVRTALTAAVRCHRVEDGVVAIDGVLREEALTREDVEAVLEGIGRRRRTLLERADGKVESVLESVVRHRLGLAKIRVRTQVGIAGVGRVDMLVGDLLIIETDGFEFHADKEAFAKDRARDRRAAALGYRTMRLTWEDVFGRWDKVLADILAVVRMRNHRRPRKRARNR